MTGAMKCSIQQLGSDVMARLGEFAPPRPSAGAGIPWPEDVVALKVRSLLPEVGSRLILEAPLPPEGGVLPTPPPSGEASASMRLMPCGLYAAEVRLPEGFVRLVSAKMSDWKGSVSSAYAPGSAEWTRQWSAEAGIAGCAERPRAYLDSDGEGRLVRLVGSAGGDEALEWLAIWSVPAPDEEGGFDFPASLYPQLVGLIALSLST